MSKWFGKIGYDISEEVEPGIWSGVSERKYYGDVLRNTKRIQNVSEINDGVSISNQISILADPFAYENFHKMLYVEFMGAKWKITEVEVQYPRLILNVGGAYNGE